MATKQAGVPWIDSILSGMGIFSQFERQVIACSAFHVCSEVGSDDSECLQANAIKGLCKRNIAL